jgi:hypothetical protein
MFLSSCTIGGFTSWAQLIEVYLQITEIVTCRGMYKIIITLVHDKGREKQIILTRQRLGEHLL